MNDLLKSNGCAMLLVMLGVLFFAAPVFSAEDKVLAVVGTEKITRSDLLEKIQMMPPQYQSRYQSDEAQKMLLDQVVKYSLLAQEARRLEIEKKADIQKRVKEIVNNMIIQELTKQEVTDKVTVSDADIQADYAANRSKYTVPEKIKVSLIFFEIKDNDSGMVRQEKRKKAEETLARLKKGESIEALAEQLSDDRRTKKRKGSTGYFARGRRANSYGQAFEDKAFALKKGELSGIVEAKNGLYIIQLMDRKAEKVQTLDEVKPRITRSLQQAKQKEAYEAYLETLRKKYSVKIME